MKIFKTIVLMILLTIVGSIAYLNNMHTTVNSDNDKYECDEVYYHPTFTFRKNARNTPSQGLYWITDEHEIISPLLIMPGMKISLVASDNEFYTLMYKENEFSGSGMSITAEDVEYLKQEIPELETNGESVTANDFYGYDDEQLIKIASDQMLGQVSSCKESNDKN